MLNLTLIQTSELGVQMAAFDSEGPTLVTVTWESTLCDRARTQATLVTVTETSYEQADRHVRSSHIRRKAPDHADRGAEQQTDTTAHGQDWSSRLLSPIRVTTVHRKSLT